MRRFVSHSILVCAIVLSSVNLIGSAEAAAPLEAIWVSVPGTISPSAPPAVERISIRASGVDVYGLPRYLVRVTSNCGGTSCASPEILAVPASGASALFTDFGFFAGSLGATPPRPYVLFGHSRTCASILGGEAMLALFMNDTRGGGYFGECFYRQPNVKAPPNPIFDKIRKQVPLPPMRPVPLTPFARGNHH